MKLISLNTWGGKYFEPLIKFITDSKTDTDIFLFQEIYSTNSKVTKYKDLVRANLLQELKKVLEDYKVFYFPVMFRFAQKEVVDFDLKFGQAIFIKKDLSVASYDDYYIFKGTGGHPGKDYSDLSTPLQKIQINYHDKTFSIFNFHGTPAPGHKQDTPKRIKQSKKVKEIIYKSGGSKILVGDFNLSMYTKSIKIIEEDMLNLIKEFDVEKTRSKLSPFYGKGNFQKFADYAFVSKEIDVKSFEVPDIKVSDHLPLILEFS